MKVYRDSLLKISKHVIILVVTLTGRGDNPNYRHNIAEHKAWKTSLEHHLMAKSLEAQVLEGVVVSKIEEPFGGFLGASPSIW